MNTPLTLLSAGLVAGTISTALHLALSPEPLARAGSPEAVEPDALTGLLTAVEQLRTEQRQLAERVAQIGLGAAAPARRVSMDEIESAVVRYMQGREAAPEKTGDGPATAAAQRPIGEIVELLLAGDGFDLDAQELWQQLRDEGRMDEVLAAFEARAAANPGDAQLQTELGEAYIQKIQEVGNGPLAGVYATKADEAFNRALELDPQHWDARFDKAVALSFWPPVFGKQNEAIQQFEILVQQQATMPQADGYAQTHLLLGNMYQQIGQSGKAVTAWQAGLAMFPDNADLLAQLALVNDGE